MRTTILLLELVALLFCSAVNAGLPDPCAINNGGCCKDAKCVPTGYGDNVCECKEGFTGDGHSCTPIETTTTADSDDTITCTAGPSSSCDVDNGGCSENAKCIETKKGTKCRCNKGFEGDGKTCTDVDECKQKLWRGYGPCHKKADCTNTIGSYECTCKEGYTGNGKSCRKITEDDDETDGDQNCRAKQERCFKGCLKCGQCNRYAKCDAVCVCRDGFVGDGYNCEDVNECEDGNNGGCDVNAQCINKPGSRKCVCKDGFTGDGLDCTEIVPPVGWGR